MTGFGRSELQNGDHTCKVEVRSVNNRFIEINARLPKVLSSLELPLKKLIRSKCARGSFDLNISLTRNNGENEEKEIKPNLPLATQYFEAFSKIKRELGLAGEIDINSILSQRDIVKLEATEVDPSKEEIILNTVEAALSELIKMREQEGENLQADILERLNIIEKQCVNISDRQPTVVHQYKDRLKEKIKTLMDGAEMDEVRLAQEAAIMHRSSAFGSSLRSTGWSWNRFTSILRNRRSPSSEPRNFRIAAGTFFAPV